MTNVLTKIKRIISKIVTPPGKRSEAGWLFRGGLMCLQRHFEDSALLLSLDEPQQKKRKLNHPESSARSEKTIRMK
jgi:hypothetical protein